MTTDASREEKIGAIFKAYREDLPVRMQSLVAVWKTLKQAWDSECADDLDRESHSIAGSAATFELPEIGKVAKEIEYGIKSLIKGEAEFDAVIINEIDMKMNALRDMVNELR